MTPTDEQLLRILIETRSIAMIGASSNTTRPSNTVGRYLTGVGYRVIPVNPNCPQEMLFGEHVRAGLSEVTESVDLICVFRRSEFVPAHFEQALIHQPNARTFWMQLGISNADVQERAVGQEITVIENRCLKIEHSRLIGAR